MRRGQARLFYGQVAEALALKFVDQFAYFLRSTEITDQKGVGCIDDDRVIDSQQYD